MNLERTPWADLAPRRASAGGEPFSPANDSADDALTELNLASAATPEAAEVAGVLHARYGTPFALYLALDQRDRRTHGGGERDQRGEADMKADFHSSYRGRVADRDGVINNTIASFGWDQDLKRLLTGHPGLAAVVSFDREAIYELAADHYELIHASDGSIYVFEARP